MNKWPAHGRHPDRITFWLDTGAQRTTRLGLISRITQSGIGPNPIVANQINSYLGGRKKTKEEKI